MSVVVSGNITQSAGATVLTFTDTTTGIGTLVSRNLVIQDSNGVQLATFNMGTNLTQDFTISADGWYRFIETIVDNTGTYPFTKDYLSTAFYDNTYVNILAQMGCGCSLSQFNYIDISSFFRNGALRLAIGGFATAAQSMITAANTYINGN